VHDIGREGFQVRLGGARQAGCEAIFLTPPGTGQDGTLIRSPMGVKAGVPVVGE